MKAVIQVILSVMMFAQSVQADTLKNVASVGSAEAILISVDDSKEEKIKKLLAMQEEIGKLRQQVEQKRKEVRNDKIVGGVGIVITAAAALFFLKMSAGDLVELGVGFFISLPLGALGLGTTGYGGYQYYVDSSKLEKLEKQIIDAQADIDKQLTELNK